MKPPKPTHVLVTTFWSYKDALIQTYTLPYLRIMHKHLPPGSIIYLLTIEQPHFKVHNHEWQPIHDELARTGIELRSFPYYPYGLRSLLNWARIVATLFFLILWRNVRFIHSFCTTSGMSGYLLSLLTGRSYLIDSYEPHAEASVENGDWRRNSFRFRLLFALERLESHRARYIVSATEGMRQYAREKYEAEFEHFYVKPACVDLNLFSEKNIKKPELLRQFGYEGKIVGLYAGKFGGIYLDREVFDFFKVAHQHWGDRLRLLILSNHKPEEIQALAKASGLDPAIIQVRFVKHADIADYMGLADFAITPVKPIPTKRYCTPIKNGEYWALGLPVVITPNISDDSEIIERHGIGAVMREFNPTDYARVVKEIDELIGKNTRQQLYLKIRKVAEQYRSFEIAEKIYHEIYGQQ